MKNHVFVVVGDAEAGLLTIMKATGTSKQESGPVRLVPITQLLDLVAPPMTHCRVVDSGALVLRLLEKVVAQVSHLPGSFFANSK